MKRVTYREMNTQEITSFGPIHLRVADLQKAILFWTKIAGLKLRNENEQTIEFGSASNTLVVVHKSAKRPYLKGYSGLYHFAIHLPDEAALASVINRLKQSGYPHSPTDHTMSKAVYFEDLEGITVEYTLETPWRVKESADAGARMTGPKPLDVHSIMKSLVDDDVDAVIDDRAFIGHIHLYANNVEKSNVFYKQLGFTQNNYNPQLVFADLGAGGDFGHRIAMNSWHGPNRPLAPADSAGLDHFQLVYKDKAQLQKVIENLDHYEATTAGYWTQDPTGNKLLLN